MIIFVRKCSYSHFLHFSVGQNSEGDKFTEFEASLDYIWSPKLAKSKCALVPENKSWNPNLCARMGGLMKRRQHFTVWICISSFTNEAKHSLTVFFCSIYLVLYPFNGNLTYISCVNFVFHSYASSWWSCEPVWTLVFHWLACLRQIYSKLCDLKNNTILRQPKPSSDNETRLVLWELARLP